MAMVMAADTGAKDALLFAMKKEGQRFAGIRRDFEQWPVLEEVEMNGQIWEQWAQLYYVEGQKYSMGQRFESRAAQGEYLFCYGPGVSKTTHCEIICEDGSFWIIDLQGEGTFVNGSRINVGNKTELKFGDIISLGLVTSLGAEINQREKDKNSTAFLFKSSGAGCHKEILISKDKDAKKENLFPAHNSLIFSKILSYLPLSDVKNCRLVSSEWTEEATNVLLKMSLTRLNFSQGYVPPIARTRLFAYIQEMGQIVSQGRFHIKLPNCICDGKLCECGFNNCGTNFPQTGTPPHKFWFDLEWFFGGGFLHPVTTLKLDGSLRCKQGVTLCKTVLERLKQTLEEIDLILDFVVKRWDPKPFCIPFFVLNTLGITLQNTYIIPREEFDEEGLIDEEEYLFQADYSHRMSDWITSMIQSAPNIQTLKLKTLTDMALEFPNLVLKTIIANDGFTNLNSLELRNYNLKTLELLLKLPQTLQSLTLELDMDDIKTWWQKPRERRRMDGDLISEDSFEFDSSDSDIESIEGDYCDSDEDGEEEDDDDIEDGYDDIEENAGNESDDYLNDKILFEKVLHKMAAELKYLCLNIPYMIREKPTTIQIQMPDFPNLKVFKLNGFHKNCITFSEFGLDYEKHFPVLEHLGIKSWTTGQDFFEIFRPIETDYQCKTMRILNLNADNLRCRWSSPSLTSLSRLAKLFPNVINPQLENFRELPPYDLEASSEERIC